LTGQRIYDLAARLFPICRSITGDGVRKTLSVLGEHVPLSVSEVPSGSQVFDWTVPREWNIRDAYIKDATGRRIVDFRQSNLHVMSYSVPVHTVLPLEELKQRIFTLPLTPDVTPYRTSYYKENWGFCMSARALEALPDGNYEVMIDSELKDGALTYAEHVHHGETDEEVLFSAHICHPSLANDNCSGLALLTELARSLAPIRTRYTYRFLFAPGTIGAITWLARNPDAVKRVRHGLVVSCVGDRGNPTYKRSRRGTAVVDRAMTHLLQHGCSRPNLHDFSPYGYDERQFCSPGFDLPIGLFQRSLHGTFPEYHTSADNLDFITARDLGHSFHIMASAIDILENDQRFLNKNPMCEPQLGRRGLYDAIGGRQDTQTKTMAMLWVLNLSDGRSGLLDIAERSGLPFRVIRDAAHLLEEHDLLERL
jgi:aminopeptidase-like protein